MLIEEISELILIIIIIYIIINAIIIILYSRIRKKTLYNNKNEILKISQKLYEITEFEKIKDEYEEILKNEKDKS